MMHYAWSVYILVKCRQVGGEVREGIEAWGEGGEGEGAEGAGEPRNFGSTEGAKPRDEPADREDGGQDDALTYLGANKCCLQKHDLKYLMWLKPPHQSTPCCE